MTNRTHHLDKYNQTTDLISAVDFDSSSPSINVAARSDVGVNALFPYFCRTLQEDVTTKRIWYGFGEAHDFEVHDGIDSRSLRQKVFASHFGHLAVIFLWTAGNLFHVSWQGNFQQWAVNPLKITPIAHAIWDPHFGSAAIEAYTPSGFTYPVNSALSGVYEWWYTIGMRTDIDLYFGAVGLLALASLFMFAGWFHLSPTYRPSLKCRINAEITELEHHLTTLVGLSSLAWAGHLIHIAIPESRGEHVRWYNFMSKLPHPAGLTPLLTGHPEIYSENPDTAGHIFGTGEAAGTAILTFLGGFHPQTGSMWLTDIAHHHLALGILALLVRVPLSKLSGTWGKTVGLPFIDSSSLKTSNQKVYSNSVAEIDNVTTESLQLRLALTLSASGVGTSLVAQHMYALPAYAFLSSSPATGVCLYVHHQFIAGCLMVGAFAHGAIYIVRDYNPFDRTTNTSSIRWLLQNKEAIISTLSWVSLFLGFHTLGIYVHNDACVAFGEPEKQILVEPVFAQFIQASSGKTGYGFEVLLSAPTSPATFASKNVWFAGWSTAVNSTTNALFLTIGPGDFLVHHAIALGLHTTTLILVKGALDARGSKLMPDKKDFGYAFPCDGPGRGGTCDISAWDAFYLAVFWMLNTISWTVFYVHWKTLAPNAFSTTSTYLMGWFSGYLWGTSAAVISGYSSLPTSSTATGVWTWMFHLAHLTWATGFMFLISWRGYWQELIETLVWAHQRTPIANQIEWVHAPVALTIVQARLVGLWHFAVGLITTYAAYMITTFG